MTWTQPPVAGDLIHKMRFYLLFCGVSGTLSSSGTRDFPDTRFIHARWLTALSHCLPTPGGILYTRFFTRGRHRGHRDPYTVGQAWVDSEFTQTYLWITIKESFLFVIIQLYFSRNLLIKMSHTVKD